MDPEKIHQIQTAWEALVFAHKEVLELKNRVNDNEQHYEKLVKNLKEEQKKLDKDLKTDKNSSLVPLQRSIVRDHQNRVTDQETHLHNLKTELGEWHLEAKKRAQIFDAAVSAASVPKFSRHNPAASKEQNSQVGGRCGH